MGSSSLCFAYVTRGVLTYMMRAALVGDPAQLAEDRWDKLQPGAHGARRAKAAWLVWVSGPPGSPQPPD